MKFQFKIILATLGILILTLILNSVLSLASFEKIYVHSLVSTYEVTANTLKRKIEQSLRFGKPLEQFQGMDRLIGDMMTSTPGLSGIVISTTDGRILYASAPALMNDPLQNLETLFAAEADPPRTRLDQGTYQTVITLRDRSRKPAGAVSLSFSREVIYRKLKQMAFDNLKILWVMLLLTSLGLIFLMAMMVVHPTKKEIQYIGDLLVWPEEWENVSVHYLSIKEGETLQFDNPSQDIPPYQHIVSRLKYMDLSSIRSEIERLGFEVCRFIRGNLDLLGKLGQMEEEQRKLLDLYSRLGTLCHRIDTVLMEIPDGHDGISLETRGVVEKFSRECFSLADRFETIRHIIDSQKQARRIGS